ncbi:hypothetical protein ACFQX4_17945 [Roseomonas sp. GCM10028921]
MGKQVALHLGDSLDAVGARFVNAWKRAETGDLHAGNAEVHLGFLSWEAMVRVLSPKRLELLDHLHRHPSPSVRQLAAALGRDGRQVHEDVVVLHRSGLLEMGEEGLRADCDPFDLFAITAQ